jgi:hypothetical protein
MVGPEGSIVCFGLAEIEAVLDAWMDIASKARRMAGLA